jgi:hypothetical protein
MTDGRDDSSDATRDAEPFALPIEAVQPSQLYLDGRKLAAVTEWFDFMEPNYDPLPVRRMRSGGESEGRWTLTDGHTRAFVAYLAGVEELRVVRDTDELSTGIYRQCVEWCEDEGVTEVRDLAGRVLSTDEFEKQWIDRCQAVTEDSE